MAAQLELSRWVMASVVAVLCLAVGVAAGVQPELAIAASFAVAFVIVAIANLVWGLYLFTFLAFLEIVPFGGQAVSFSKLLGLLLFLSWLMVMTADRSPRIDRAVVQPAAVLLAALLGWTLLSATWAEEPAGAFEAVYRYALNAGYFIIVVTAIRTREHAVGLVIAFIVGAAIAAVYGLVTPSQFESDFGRIESAALDPNELSAVLVPALSLCMFAAFGLRGHPALRLSAVVIGAISVMTILFTVSRGGLIALVAMMLAAIVVGGRWRLPIAIATATLALGGYIYFAGFASSDAVDHLQSTTQGDERVAEGRYTIWQVGWRMAEGNPVRGVGGGNFKVSSRHYLLQPGDAPRSDLIIDKPLVAHNTYLETLVELGVVGLTAFLGLIGFCFACALRAAAGLQAPARHGDGAACPRTGRRAGRDPGRRFLHLRAIQQGAVAAAGDGPGPVHRRSSRDGNLPR